VVVVEVLGNRTSARQDSALSGIKILFTRLAGSSRGKGWLFSGESLGTNGGISLRVKRGHCCDYVRVEGALSESPLTSAVNVRLICSWEQRCSRTDNTCLSPLGDQYTAQLQSPTRPTWTVTGTSPVNAVPPLPVTVDFVVSSPANTQNLPNMGPI